MRLSEVVESRNLTRADKDREERGNGRDVDTGAELAPLQGGHWTRPAEGLWPKEVSGSNISKKTPTYGAPYLELRDFDIVRSSLPPDVLRQNILGTAFENINHIEDACDVQLRLRGGEVPHFLIRAKDEASLGEAQRLIRQLVEHVS